MKTILTAIFLIGILLNSLLADDAKQTLIVEAPATWALRFKGEKGIQSYSLINKEGETALLMFSQTPTLGNVNQIPEQIEAMAKNFSKRVKESKGRKLKNNKYVIGKIAGDTFTGSFAKFEFDDGDMEIMFMIGDDNGIWNGQFSGTEKRWDEAMTILKKLKKNG